jgi:hypothetical protein
MDLGRMPGIERAAARSALLRSNDPLFRSETLKSLARPRGVEPLTPRSVVWHLEFSHGSEPIHNIPYFLLFWLSHLSLNYSKFRRCDC